MKSHAVSPPNFLQDVDPCIEGEKDHSLHNDIQASVVIVTYRRPRLLLECLASLSRQSVRNFETIVVDNGGNADAHDQLVSYRVNHIRLKGNQGLSTGKNVGVTRARSENIIFLDDDATAHPDFVKSILNSYEKRDIVGLRGKIIPRSDVIYNELQQIYDLGNEVHPAVVLSGVCSFKREAVERVGGFNPGFFGHEDGEFSYRIVQAYGRDRLIYDPQAIIYHDTCDSYSKYVEKMFRHAVMGEKLRAMHPDIITFLKGYDVRRNPLQTSGTALPHRLRRHLIWRSGQIVDKMARWMHRMGIAR